jgi:hypothetical protein
MRRKLLPLSLGFYFLISPLAFAASDPQVEFFSPQGTVKTTRQVSVRFSEAMVPLGDPRGFIEPFEAAVQRKETADGLTGETGSLISKEIFQQEFDVNSV